MFPLDTLDTLDTLGVSQSSIVSAPLDRSDLKVSQDQGEVDLLWKQPPVLGCGIPSTLPVLSG